jgi:regulatory protein
VAQKWRVPRSTSNRNISALDADSLERLALRYVERYATTRSKLARYLDRKLRQRGWSGADDLPTAAIVEKMARLGFVDDRQFASMRAAALTRRGYGNRRIDADLRAAGISNDDIADTVEEDADAIRDAALLFARKKRIGPFFQGEADEAARRRAFAAMVRAGHPVDIIREILTSSKRYD